LRRIRGEELSGGPGDDGPVIESCDDLLSVPDNSHD
jgi:hypothetical protein